MRATILLGVSILVAFVVTVLGCSATTGAQRATRAADEQASRDAHGIRPLLDESAKRKTERFGVLEIRVTRGGGALGGLDLYLRIDGQLRGPLPARFEDVPAGLRELQIQDDHGRYEVFSESVEIEAGKTVEFKPQLVVQKGRVVVRAGRATDGATF
jgi:hypothetical protein